MRRDLDERLRKFAVRILRLCEALKKIPGARQIAGQLERSGPSIGHNYAESQGASSKAHFISLIEICEREARETQFALGVVMDKEFVKPSLLVDLYQESCEIVAIMTTIGQKTKKGIKKKASKK